MFDFGFVPKQPSMLSLFTALFIHASPVHIIVNMALFWLFGRDVEAALGAFRFLCVYFVGGIGAVLAQAAAVLAVQNQETLPILGASGCVAAVCGVFAVRFQYVRVSIRPPQRAGTQATATWIDLPAWPIWTALLATQIVGAARALLMAPANTAHWGHLTGFAVGAIAGAVTRRTYTPESNRYAAKARTAAAHGDLWSAAQFYDTALRQAGDHPELLLEAAEVRERLGEDADALNLYARAIESQMSAGRFSDAAALARRLSSQGLLRKLMPGLRFRVASLLEQQGRYDAAAEILWAIADADGAPEDRALALYRAGRIEQCRLGRPDRAAEAYTRLSRDFPHSQWTPMAREELSRIRSPHGEGRDGAN
ncbi:MAG: rhomboid family intramembrane serine protease [Armatimonadota bacterium]